MENQPMYTVIRFDPEHLPAFIRLNRQWIETHFVVEPMDVQQLEKAEESILKPGGEIFFILAGGKVVATVAMIPHGPGCYELAKMAVDPEARGQGYGDVLIRTCLDWAREKGASKVMLLSNTVLTPAITLYKKHGFKTVRLGDHPDYQRCNIEMEIDIGPSPKRE